MSWVADKTAITTLLGALGYTEVKDVQIPTQIPASRTDKGYVLRPVSFSQLNENLTGNTNFAPYGVELYCNYFVRENETRDSAFDSFGSVLDSLKGLTNFISFNEDDATFTQPDEDNLVWHQGFVSFLFTPRTC